MAAHPVMSLVLAGVACSALIASLAGGAAVAAVLGMAAPLAAAAGSWVVLERAHQRRAEGASGVMIKLFGAKMVFFALYIPVVVLLAPEAVTPFVASFVANYILLHGIEAWHLRRLFARPAGQPGLSAARHV